MSSKILGVKQLITVMLMLFSVGAFAIDTDQDGLPDDWEIAHGRDPARADYVVSLNSFGASYSNQCAIANGVLICSGQIPGSLQSVTDFYNIKLNSDTSATSWRGNGTQESWNPSVASAVPTNSTVVPFSTPILPTSSYDLINSGNCATYVGGEFHYVSIPPDVYQCNVSSSHQITCETKIYNKHNPCGGSATYYSAFSTKGTIAHIAVTKSHSNGPLYKVCALTEYGLELCTMSGFHHDPDGDGVEGLDDAFPLNAAASVDTDGDGHPDAWNVGCNLTCQQNSGLTLDAFPNDPTQWHIAHNIKSNFSKDSASDVLWYDNSTGNINIWNMQNGALANWNFIGYWPDTANVPTLTGDINNDGSTDILWYNNTTGDVDAWTMQAGARTDWTFLGYWPDANIIPVLVGDFDYDGDDDILWYNSTTGDVDIWVMQAGARVDWLYVGYWPDPNFKPVLVGDFDGDGDDDILWWNNVSGDVDIWVMQNNTRSNWLYVGTWPDVTNKPVGVGDFNNDGTDDILWYNSSTGDVNLWTMQAGARGSWTYIGALSDTNNHIEEIGDFNGDGTADILWRDITTGSVTTWPMLNGVKQAGQYIGTFSGNNSIKAGL